MENGEQLKPGLECDTHTAAAAGKIPERADAVVLPAFHTRQMVFCRVFFSCFERDNVAGRWERPSFFAQ